MKKTLKKPLKGTSNNVVLYGEGNSNKGGR